MERNILIVYILKNPEKIEINARKLAWWSLQYVVRNGMTRGV